MYEGDTQNSNVSLSHCYVDLRRKTNYNHLWCRELGKLPNVILNEGDLDNINKQINELCCFNIYYYHLVHLVIIQELYPMDLNLLIKNL